MHRLLPATLFLMLVSTLAWGADPRQPNIVLFMADDFGYECVTANGGESYQTPNLDRLAANGIRFEHCHVQPLCTPTRVQLMTGRYNIRNYIQFGTLPRTETTFAHLLKKAGYTTGIVGKWQLGRETDSPQYFGFDESCLWQHTRRPPRYANPGLEYNGVEKDFNDGQYGPTLINDYAVDFIKRHPSKPFFLYYPMILTHSPYQPTPDSPNWNPKTKSENADLGDENFAEMVKYMDKMVGRVLATLESQKLLENTLVIFLGDNGTGKGTKSRFRGREVIGAKGSTIDRGTHVPLIVHWPAQIRTPHARQDLISSTDILPTLCEVAGVAIPSNVDGVSFAPQLRGEKGKPREWLYTWYSPRQSKDLTVKEYAFDHHFKLYRTGHFFDLQADPDETNPLSLASLNGDAKLAAQRLQQALDQYTDARPIALDRLLTSRESTAKEPEKAKKGKGKKAKSPK